MSRLPGLFLNCITFNKCSKTHRAKRGRRARVVVQVVEEIALSVELFTADTPPHTTPVGLAIDEHLLDPLLHCREPGPGLASGMSLPAFGHVATARRVTAVFLKAWPGCGPCAF